MAEKQDKEAADRAAFRRQCALAVMTGFVTRHGGLGSDVEREANARMIWSFADSILDHEHSGRWVSPAETELAEMNRQQAAKPRGRPASPSDEWGVRLGSKLKRGFVTKAEAEAYAFEHPGATVQQLGGPEVEAGRLIANPSVTA